jgi:hypothetical protein
LKFLLVFTEMALTLMLLAVGVMVAWFVGVMALCVQLAAGKLAKTDSAQSLHAVCTRGRLMTVQLGLRVDRTLS